MCRATYFSLLMVCLSACENDVTTVSELFSGKLGVEEAHNVSITYTMGGKATALLTAPLMLRSQDSIPSVEFTKSIHVDFFNPAGQVESKLDAKYARYKENQGLVFIRDNVRVINLFKGDTLDCQELYWDRQLTGREFYTDKPVRIRTPTQAIDGVGMESGQDFKNWKISKPIGTIGVPAVNFPE